MQNPEPHCEHFRPLAMILRFFFEQSLASAIVILLTLIANSSGLISNCKECTISGLAELLSRCPRIEPKNGVCHVVPESPFQASVGQARF